MWLVLKEWNWIFDLTIMFIMFAHWPGFPKEGTNRVMKLNAKISEIASPKTVFDKKLPALSAIYIDKPVGPRFGQVVSKMWY